MEKTLATDHAQMVTDEPVASDSSSNGTIDLVFGRNETKLLRKLDWILMPWLFLLLLVSFLDRSNIGNAKLYGLTEDLHIDDQHYHIALSLFYVFYACFEPLANVLIKKFRPSIFIPTIMMLWGLSLTCMGFVKNFSGLTALRILLGIFEAGLFPGICHYLSCWYKRGEVGVRIALFFCASSAAGSFGGLLAAAIASIKVGSGMFAQSWRWIFIIEGVVTIFIGLVSFWAVQDYPDQAKFLSKDEHRWVIERLEADGQSSAHHEDFSRVYLWASLKDWKTWMYCVMYMGCNMPLNAFALFIPSVINGLGDYSSTVSNLLTVPPYALGALGTVFVGWLADRTRHRGWCNVGFATLGAIGFSIILSDAPNQVKYFAVFLSALGIYPCGANTISWMANNVEGVYKRGITMGIVIGWGNLNGIVSSNIYLSKDAPRYRLGHGVVLAYLVIFLIGSSLMMHFTLAAENRKRRAGKRDHVVESKSAGEIDLMGDLRPDFHYAI